MTLPLLLLLAWAVSTFWYWCAIYLTVARIRDKVKGTQTPPSTAAVDLFHELRPFFVPAMLAQPLLEALCGIPWSLSGGLNNLLVLATGLLMWDSGGDDDRWKRRRRKLAAKVQAVGGRLVVVPAGAR